MRALVMQERTQLTNWGRAYLMLGLIATRTDRGSPELRILLSDLTTDIIASANANHWEDGPTPGSWHDSTVRTTALVLRAISESDLGHPLVEETAGWSSPAPRSRTAAASTAPRCRSPTSSWAA